MSKLHRYGSQPHQKQTSVHKYETANDRNVTVIIYVYRISPAVRADVNEVGKMVRFTLSLYIIRLQISNT